MHRLATMQRGTQGQSPDFAQAWTLDKVGNWTAFNDNGTNENRTHNALNQLTVRARNNLVYDANGNQTDDGVKYTFVYDANNRLKEVHDRVTGQAIMTCKYDAMGRRVQRSVLVPAEGQTGGTTRYCYAGQRIVEEYDADNLIQAVYTYGQYIDEPLSMDHVATSQPASQPANGLTGMNRMDGMETAATPTAVPTFALTYSTPAPSPTQNSELITQNSPTPSAISATSAVDAPSSPTPDAVATQVAVMYATPTPSPVPADPVATEIALAYGTPTPAGGGAATPVPTNTPDPLATQIALVYGTPTPLSLQDVGQVPSPVTPSPIQLSLTPTPFASSAVPTPSPTQNSVASQPSLIRYYYHAKRLYSVCALTDAQGNVVERYRYDAYGLCTTLGANYDNPMEYSRFGNPFTYTGRELDSETGFMHYRWRPYSPKQGRFMQNDRSGYIDSCNLYQYCNSNPLIYVDPSGLEKKYHWCNSSDEITIKSDEQDAQNQIDSLIKKLSTDISSGSYKGLTQLQLKKAKQILECAKQKLNALDYQCECCDAIAHIFWIFDDKIHICTNNYMQYDKRTRAASLVHESTHACGTTDAAYFWQNGNNPSNVGLIGWQDIASTYDTWLINGYSVPQ